MKMNVQDTVSVLLIALVTALPVIAGAPATFGLGPVAGAWLGLIALVAGVLLNRRDKVGDGE